MKLRTKLDITPDRGALVGLIDGYLNDKVYSHAKNRILQTGKVTFIEEDFDQLYVYKSREGRLDRTIQLETKSRKFKKKAKKSKHSTQVDDIDDQEDGTKTFNKTNIGNLNKNAKDRIII